MTYEKLQIKAQQLANVTGKTTCIYERYSGYKVGVLTEKTLGGCQETFDPGFQILWTSASRTSV